MNPAAVAISDVHFTLATIDLAAQSLNMAISTARRYGVPLVINGDLLDTKAVMRGEIVNKLIAMFEYAALRGVQIILNVGNHEMINSKGTEHTLNFLRPYALIADECTYFKQIDSWVIPYIDDPNKFREILKDIPKGSRLFIHQGLHGADMGHYVSDPSALSKEDFESYRVISGHYHKRQDIKCARVLQGEVGLFSYLGNPYTLSYGEANDPGKGFHILLDNGKLEFVPTVLRRHIVHEAEVNTPIDLYPHPEDLVWLKLKGTSAQLSVIEKADFPANFKIDLIPTDKVELTQVPEGQTKEQGLDSVIDSTNITEEQKERLKKVWRSLV